MERGPVFGKLIWLGDFMIKRELEKEIKKRSEAFPVVAILGPRQSGKTTLAKHIFKNYKYLSLENLTLREDAKSDPEGFLKVYDNEPGIILDEFQHVPELLSYIQLTVDVNRRPGFFILTGSQNFLMNRAISQTLAGRIAITTLLPLSITELENADLLPNLIEDLVFKGQYPELYSNEKLLPKNWYSNYIKTYIERDVRDLKNVQNLTTFSKFMKLCAARIGQVINFASLASDVEVDVVTAKSWLSLLETSYIIFFLQPYSAKFTRRLIKTPKLFFYDTGLASNLLNLRSVDDLKISPYRGNLIESLIISNIAKLYYNEDEQPNIYFLRDKTGHEIDCILEKTNSLMPIEIKSNMTAKMSFFDEINFWKNTDQIGGKKIEDGFIIYSGDETQKRTYGTFLSWKDIAKIKKYI